MLCAASSCFATSVAPAVAQAPSGDWRRVATEEDRDRLRRWRQAWTEAFARLGRDDSVAGLTQGALFDPDRALPGAVPPPGAYTCRIIKLGANGAAMRDLTVYAPTACSVSRDGGQTMLYKTSGIQRPVGTLYADGGNRAVFLGTLVLGDETKPLAYGRDLRRDLAGYVERIGERRWRLVFPYPRFESLLDVVELTPAP